MSRALLRRWPALNQVGYRFWGLLFRRVLARAVIARGRHAVDHVGHGCSSWYLGKDGLPELFPWAPMRYTELLRRPEAADFEVS